MKATGLLTMTRCVLGTCFSPSRVYAIRRFLYNSDMSDYVYESSTNIDKELRSLAIIFACVRKISRLSLKKGEARRCGPRRAASNLRRTCFDAVDRFAMATS